MRELVQLGVATYVIPETRRDIFSSDLEIGNQQLMVVTPTVVALKVVLWLYACA
jgi:hypothetical protein